MKRIFIFFLVFISVAQVCCAQQPAYGYWLHKDSHCSLWWAEGAYKVRLDDSPSLGKQEVHIQMASNETEPFQLIVKPEQEIKSLKVLVSDVRNKNGNRIAGFSSEVLEVDYVKVTDPTDNLAKAGLYPDPAPRYKIPVNLEAGINHPFWINIMADKTVKAGSYVCTVQLKSKIWKMTVPVQIKVWNFTLPDKSSMRSSFGISPDFIKTYHHLNTEKEVRQETDKYYRFMAQHRIAPTSPMDLYPLRVQVSGLKWTTGTYERQKPYEGRYCLKVNDESVSVNTETETVDYIEVNSKQSYDFSFYARVDVPHKVTACIEAYNKDKQFLPYKSMAEAFDADLTWKNFPLSDLHFSDQIKYIKIILCPVLRDESGSTTGTAYFDAVILQNKTDKNNLIPCGNFEVNPDKIDVNVDFSDFDKGARMYLDGLKFNAFNLAIEGMGNGYYSHRDGVFHGFVQDTPEYDKLMGKYLGQIQDHLEQNGWLGKEYIYWFDEPGEKDYPFVRKGMETIHKAAPKLTRFITEDYPGPAIMDVTEMNCTIWEKINPTLIYNLSQKGKEFWSYICCGPKAPYINEFIEHDAINMRMWLWMSYQYNLKGVLIWGVNYWNSGTASPQGYLQNPWEDPMSYAGGYGMPKGKIWEWGNGDGRYIYPPQRDPNKDLQKNMDEPVTSIRLEILREGMEDYEYFKILEKLIHRIPDTEKNLVQKASNLLHFGPEFFTDGKTYTKDPQLLLKRRAQIAEMIELLSQKN